MKVTVVSAPRLVALFTDINVQRTPILIAATSERVAVKITHNSTQTTKDRETKALIAFVGKWLHVDVPQDISISTQMRDGIKFPADAVSWCVALVGALIYAWTGRWNPLQIQDIAYAYFKSRQPAAGGLVTTAVIGGFVWYREELSFLKNIWQLPIVLDKSLQRFYVLPERHKGAQKITMEDTDTKRFTEALKANDEKTLIAVLSKGNNEIQYVPQGTKFPHDAVHILLGVDGVTLDQKS